jgi:hypothetical protein
MLANTNGRQPASKIMQLNRRIAGIGGRLFTLRPVLDFPVASVSNADEMPPIERQLCGTSTVKIFGASRESVGRF